MDCFKVCACGEISLHEQQIASSVILVRVLTLADTIPYLRARILAYSLM